MSGLTPRVFRCYVVGDILDSLNAVLLDGNGDPIDLTGLTIVFRMVDAQTGTVKVDNKAVTILDALSASVTYDWDAADVDTASSYWGYFIRQGQLTGSGHNPVLKKLNIKFVTA